MKHIINFLRKLFGLGKSAETPVETNPDPTDNGPVVATSPANWFMYHGGYNHGGNIDAGSNLNSTTIKSNFDLLHSIDVEGSILSVPAVVDGYIYVGVANSHNAAVVASNGGTMYKINIETADIAAQYSWQLTPGEGDSHGFYGMGCTPTVINEKVYFSAFNGRVYCLSQHDLSHVWDTDLRNNDPSKNQPICNTSEHIISRIFGDATLLQNFRNHILDLCVEGGQAIAQVMINKNYEVDTANEINQLEELLEAAENANDKQKINDLTEKIEKIISGLIDQDPQKFEQILQGAIPLLGLPVAAGWCSPVVVNFGGKSKLYVGVAEGENPLLFGVIYVLDGDSGNVDWIYCTNKFDGSSDNPPNVLPAAAVDSAATPGYSYTTSSDMPACLGCSVWSAIAYDEGTNMIYASTGNPVPDDQPLPTPGYSNGILALKADTGDFVAFRQIPDDTNYRPTDVDVDIASACTLFELNGKKVISVGCKNGGFMVCDANTLELINHTTLLPKMNNGDQIPEIDPHPTFSQQNELAPHVSNEVSNTNQGENYFGPFNTAAVYPEGNALFIGIGGPNYHNQGPGIDYNTTPFMKAIDMTTLKDCWPMDNNDPPRYTNSAMYKNAGECGLSSPAVVNDVVFCTTTGISIYAFSAKDGTLLWSKNIGQQTQGLNGGYGYCLGPAIYGDYVIAGGLILGQSGGILEVYGLKK